MWLRLFTAVVIVSAVGCAGRGQAQEATTRPAMPKIAFENYDRNVLAVGDAQVLVSSVELIESTRNYRAQSATFRWYLQTIGQPGETLVETGVGGMRGGGGRSDPPDAVISGNLVIRLAVNRAIWLDIQQGTSWSKDLRLGDKSARCAAIYADGAVFIVLPPSSLARSSSAYWVPIKSGDFDYQAVWLLTGERGQDYHVNFGRSGNRLFWIGASSPPGQNTPGKYQAHLAVADLDKRTIDIRDLSQNVGPHSRIRAFDGKTIYTGARFIDVDTAKVTETESVVPLGMINGTLYGARDEKEPNTVSLVSIDVSRPMEVNVLQTMKEENPKPGAAPASRRLQATFIVREKDIIYWDGTMWNKWPMPAVDK